MSKEDSADKLDEPKADVVDTATLQKKVDTLQKQNPQLADLMKDERKQHRQVLEYNKSRHSKKRYDPEDPRQAVVKELGDALFEEDKFLEKGDRNLDKNDPHCLGMQFVNMCIQAGCPLDTNNGSVEMQWHTIYFFI